MKSPFKAIVIAILIGLAGYYWGIKEYFVGSKEKVSKYEQLASTGVSALAALDTVYTEIKIGGLKSYTINYFFTVDGQQYKGTHSFGSQAEAPAIIIPIKYMKDNPAINESNKDDNILKELHNAQENAKSKFNLWVGIGFLVLSALMILGAIRSIKQRPNESESMAVA